MNSIENQQRRAWVKQAMAACGLVMVPSAVWAASSPKSATAPVWLTAVCDCVIPDTDVPGAVAAKVPGFVQMAAAHGLEGARASLIAQFEHLFNEYSGNELATLSAHQLEELLEPLDSAAYSHPRGQALPDVLAAWKTLKSLIVLGYYTSEIGSSQALRYVLVPGRFDPDVPLSDNPKAFSSDWTGVKYG